DALIMLEKASRLPMIDLPRNDRVLPAFAWKAVEFAYQARQYEVAIALCDQWEGYWKNNGHVGDSSFFTFRAASFLALGNYQRASTDCDYAMRELRRRNNWAGNLEQLQTAIETHDKNFNYDPGKGLAPFTILINYQ